MRQLACAAVLFLITVVPGAMQNAERPQQRSSRAPATPVDPIGAIVEGFRSHSIVTLSDPHGNQQVLAFMLALLRDPRIHQIVNDVVVENGNARYQGSMDRYAGGEDVPYTELRQIWENTTQPQVVTPRDGFVPEPIRTIREVNAALPRERRIRVVLGDPPIDWEAVQTRDDFRAWLELRDSYPAAVIQTQVLAKKRRALVIYGQMHAQRRQLLANYDMSDWRAHTIVSILEKTTPTRVFSIWWARNLDHVAPRVRSWRVPALAISRGTDLGAIDFAAYFPHAGRAAVRDGTLVPVPREQWRSLPMEEQFDAVLYLGSSTADTPSAPMPQVCADHEYVQERLRRMAIGAPPPVTAEFKERCVA